MYISGEETLEANVEFFLLHLHQYFCCALEITEYYFQRLQIFVANSGLNRMIPKWTEQSIR